MFLYWRTPWKQTLKQPIPSHATPEQVLKALGHTYGWLLLIDCRFESFMPEI